MVSRSSMVDEPRGWARVVSRFRCSAYFTKMFWGRTFTHSPAAAFCIFIPDTTAVAAVLKLYDGMSTSVDLWSVATCSCDA